MPNIFDYLTWRGDLSFEADPFNEVDSLILCKLCGVDLSGAAPEENGARVTVREASERYFALHGDATGRLGVLNSPHTLPMFKVIGGYPRFAALELSDYICRIDTQREEQFSAVTVSGFPDGSRYVAFKGTDDTIVAWKENLNMCSADAVPAQIDAAAYLERAAWLGVGPLRVGGHSKGGNLAVYSALHGDREVQDRLLDIYNFDGPGFRENVLDSPEYRRIRDRVTTLVPQYSLVGMLLCHEEDYDVVTSDETGMSAHDGFTWEVSGKSFVRSGDLALRARVLDSAVHNWVCQTDMEHRRQFVDTVYELLTSTGAATLSELTEHKLRQAMELIGTLRQEPEQRALLTETLELLIKEYVYSGLRALPLPSLSRVKVPVKLRRRKKEEEPSPPPAGK